MRKNKPLSSILLATILAAVAYSPALHSQTPPAMVLETCRSDENSCRKMSDSKDVTAQIGMAKRKLTAGDPQQASQYFALAAQQKSPYALAWLMGNISVQTQKYYYAQELGKNPNLIALLPFILQAGFLPTSGGDSMLLDSYLKPPRLFKECLKGMTFCRAASAENPDLARVLIGQILERQGNLVEAEYEYRQTRHPYGLWRLSNLSTDSKLSDLEKLTQKKQNESALNSHPSWSMIIPFIE
ncbi:MAG: hypothetical protein QM523_11385 [Candidatus Pacebacteria bacterium]|nr:hypothetical protein [Candidatus Paceibacterota bacterium]